MTSAFQCLQDAFWTVARSHAFWHRYSDRHRHGPLVQYADSIIDVLERPGREIADRAHSAAAMLGFSQEDRGQSPWVQRNPIPAITCGQFQQNLVEALTASLAACA